MEQAMFPQNENSTLFDNEALFDAEGHLTDEGLHALQESRLDELGSLEAAEHLTFCDYCLARYTALIESAPEKLKQPMRDLIPQVQALMRLRSFPHYDKPLCFHGCRRNAGLCAVAVRVLWRRWYGAKARAAAAGRYPQSDGKPGAWWYV